MSLVLRGSLLDQIPASIQASSNLIASRWCSRAAKAAPPRVTVSDSRQEEDLRSAILQLNRSAGLLCRDEMLNELGLAPQDWPPFPTLAGQACTNLSLNLLTLCGFGVLTACQSSLPETCQLRCLIITRQLVHTTRDQSSCSIEAGFPLCKLYSQGVRRTPKWACSCTEGSKARC